MAAKITDNGESFNFNGYNIDKRALTPDLVDQYTAAAQAAAKVADLSPTGKQMWESMPFHKDGTTDDSGYGVPKELINYLQSQAKINPAANQALSGILGPSSVKEYLSQSNSNSSSLPPMERQPDGTVVRNPIVSKASSTMQNARQQAIKGYFTKPPDTKSIEKDTQNELVANARLADVQANEADQAAKQMELANAQQEQMLQQQQQQRAIVDAQIEKRRQEINADTDKLAAERVDANRFWNKKSSGDKFMAGLAIVMGGIGAGIAGQNDNKALDVIREAINRDVDEQKFNIEKGNKDIGNKRMNLQDAQNDALMREQRSTMDREVQYKLAMAKIEQLKQASQSKEIKAKLDIVNQGLLKDLSKLQYNADLTAKEIYGKQLGTFLQMDNLNLQRAQLAASREGKSEDIFTKIARVQSTMGANNKVLKDYQEAKEARNIIKQARKTGSINIAQAKLISKWLDQGSYAESWAKQLPTTSVFDAPQNFFNKQAKGYDPNAIDQFEKLVDMQYNTFLRAAQPQIDLYRQAGKAYGIGENYFMPEDNTAAYDAMGPVIK